jgi:lysophospholipase
MSDSRAFRRAYPEDATLSEAVMADGWPLRTFNWPAEGHARGAILFQGGRGDIIEKYLESFADWHGAGWSVTAFDWRGQGGSGRFLDDRQIGHCPEFGIWIDDLATFWADWKAKTSGPYVLMGHSMGGHLVLRALAEKRVTPDAAVLIAPMLGFDTGILPLAVAEWGVSRLVQIGWGEKPAWKKNERPAPPWSSRQKFLTSDVARYDDEVWWKTRKPELEFGPPSFTWLEQAYSSVLALQEPGAVEAIETPTLTLATKGDKLVDPHAIAKFANRIPHGRLRMFDKSVAHEILRERDGVRGEALREIADFLAKFAPAR